MKVGIVGAGGMGHVHGSKYSLMPDVELHVFDISRYQRETFASRHGATPHDTEEGLLSVVDIVDVCTPTDSHKQCCLDALTRGIPTVVEKPMAGSISDCEEMIKAAGAKRANLMPAQVVRWFPDFRRAHDLVVNGAVGRPASIRLRRGGKAPQGTDGWFQDPYRSGGVLLDLAVHDFDWLRWTVGPVVEVMSKSVVLGKRVKDADFVGDYALTTLTHASGCISHVESTWLDPSGFRTTMEVSGSQGVIEYDSRVSTSLRLCTTDGMPKSESLLSAMDDPYYLQLRSFVDAVAAGVEAPVTAEDGMEAVRLSLAAIESASTGRPVRI